MLLTIPKRHQRSLATLFGFSPAKMKALVAGVRNAPPAISLYDLALELSPQTFGLGRDELYFLLEMLASLYRVRTEWEFSVKEFVAELCHAAEEIEPLPKPHGGSWPQLKKGLADIFRSDASLGLTAKASELVLEYERRFCPHNCRILSDVRPVFMEAAAAGPAAVIVQHILKIAYHEGEEGDLKDFYVSLDGDDIRRLQALLKRATEKEKSIRKMMKGAKVPVLGQSRSDAE